MLGHHPLCPSRECSSSGLCDCVVLLLFVSVSSVTLVVSSIEAMKIAWQNVDIALEYVLILTLGGGSVHHIRSTGRSRI